MGFQIFKNDLLREWRARGMARKSEREIEKERVRTRECEQAIEGERERERVTRMRESNWRALPLSRYHGRRRSCITISHKDVYYGISVKFVPEIP